MPNQLVLERESGRVTVCAAKNWVLVDNGWTVAIGASDIRDYVRDFGRDKAASCDGGFVLHDGRYTLSHRDAKMTFSVAEASTIATFLADYYDVD